MEKQFFSNDEITKPDELKKTFLIPKALSKRLKIFAANEGLTEKEVILCSIRQFLDEMDSRKDGRSS